MKVYLVTHGDCYSGYNPTLTEDGITQIQRISAMIPFQKITLVVMGTGQRFVDTYNALITVLASTPVKFSPFCGSADGSKKYGVIAIAGVMILSEDYIGVSSCAAFDAWKFISSLPADTLLCSGGELMIALGLGDINKKAQLYELDTETRTGRQSCA